MNYIKDQQENLSVAWIQVGDQQIIELGLTLDHLTYKV